MKNSILITIVLILANVRFNAQTWQWVREEAAGPEAFGVACDNAGNVFLSGYTAGAASIGTVVNSSTVSSSAAIAKYDANGNVLWVSFIPGSIGYNVACDASGNAFLCGYFSNTLTVGSQTLVSSGSFDLFVVKYSPTGTILWAASIGGNGGDFSNCVNVDALGNVIVSGYIASTSTFTFGSSNITSASSSGNRYFVAKYTNNGTPLWATYGTNGNSISYYVSSDASGDIYLTGYFTATASIGSNTYISSGSTDFYLAKFSSAGLPVWSVVGGGTSSDLGYCVRAHPSGDVFVTGGYSSSPFTLSTTSFTSAGGSDMFLARFNNMGNLIWAIRGGGSGGEVAYSMAAHAGGVYVGGSLGITPAAFGTATLTPPQTSDNMFLCGIDNSGSVAYAQYINGGGDDVMALDMYNGCSLYLGGDVLTPTLTLGAFTLTHTASEVFFVAKFNTGINSPTLNLSPSYTLCQGNTMTLTASGAATYTWDNGPNTNNLVISPATTTNYVVAGTSTAGCSTKSVVTVVVVPGSTTLSAVGGTPFCSTNTATLSMAGANTSTWNTGATTTSIMVSPSITSVYTVSGTSSSGCFYSNSYTLAVIPVAPITATVNHPTICKGNTATITASGASLYLWSTGSQQTTTTVSPASTTTYVVTGTNTANGCVTKAVVQVSVNGCAGLNEQKKEAQFVLYPNPSTGELQIQVDKDLTGASMLLRNLQGEIILSRQILNETERISGLSPGIYFISVQRSGIPELNKKVVVE